MAAIISSRVLRPFPLILSRCFNSNVTNLNKPVFLNKCFRETIRFSSQWIKKGASRNGSNPILVAVGIGVAFASGSVFYELYAAPSRQRFGSFAEIDTADGADKKTTVSLPKDLKISRKVEGPTNFLDIELVLFQYQSCPFCCKVRAFLDFYGIPYSIVEVNPVLRSEIKFSQYKKVPILMVRDSNGEYHQLNDSSAIVSILGTYLLNPANSIGNVLPKYQSITYVDEDTNKKVTEIMNRYFLLYADAMLSQQEYDKLNEERKWRVWVDNHFVHLISPNIYRTLGESKESFEQFSINGNWESIFSSWQRWSIINVGAWAMYFIGNRLKTKYNLKDDVRESLYDASNLWMKALDGKTFMGGKQPNLADLAVYGVLNSFEGCRAFKDLEKHTKIGRWYTDVKSHLLSHTGASQVPRLKDTKNT